MNDFFKNLLNFATNLTSELTPNQKFTTLQTLAIVLSITAVTYMHYTNENSGDKGLTTRE